MANGRRDRAGRKRRWVRWCAVGVLLVCGVAGALVAQAYWRVHGRTLLEFSICQNTDVILFSDFGEPPQFAIWLEDPVANRVQTVFVTRRSATGDWEGKAECPGSLPRWFEIYRQESGRDGLPTPEAPAPDAVSGATPKGEHFAWAVEVEPGSAWICWIEVNLSGDYNAAFQELDEATGRMDTDQSGQPSLLYRGEIVAECGAVAHPELYGYAAPGGTLGEVKRDFDGLTSAQDIFESIEIRAVRPRVTLF
ncbi:MAG: hypothetical protein JXR94_11025 [Candidatus Hydrogenedentes bacterium]|nr:hypothetical protein [Candidatus Hydrogenedentota bacterium]